jgi:hypothetical protein
LNRFIDPVQQVQYRSAEVPQCRYDAGSQDLRGASIHLFATLGLPRGEVQ